MKIVMCADHAGFELKEQLKDYLSKSNDIIDVGANAIDNEDSYVDYAKKANKQVVDNNCYGIYVCGSGVGMSIVANKQRGIRAVMPASVELVEKSRQHNNANVLCLGARFMTLEEAKKIVDKFLSTDFLGGKYQTRLQSIED